MHYNLDPYNYESTGQVFSLDGERVGIVKEADTAEGYIKRLEYTPGATTFPLLIKYGRVDYLGNMDKDSAQVLHERLNKVRSEMGLHLYPWSE